MDKETTSLLKPLLSSDTVAKAESADTPLEPASRLHKAQHVLVPVVRTRRKRPVASSGFLYRY
jgi:hypothetical protein